MFASPITSVYTIKTKGIMARAQKTQRMACVSETSPGYPRRIISAEEAPSFADCLNVSSAGNCKQANTQCIQLSGCVGHLHHQDNLDEQQWHREEPIHIPGEHML